VPVPDRSRRSRTGPPHSRPQTRVAQALRASSRIRARRGHVCRPRDRIVDSVRSRQGPNEFGAQTLCMPHTAFPPTHQSSVAGLHESFVSSLLHSTTTSKDDISAPIDSTNTNASMAERKAQFSSAYAIVMASVLAKA
jgi:hypothetical protein